MLPTAHPFSRRRFIASASAAAGALALPATLRSQATPKLYTIRSVWLGRYVDAHEVESLDWQMVVRTRQAPPADQTQHWQLIPVGDGYFEIRQSSSQRYADAHDGTMTTGAWSLARDRTIRRNIGFWNRSARTPGGF